MIVDKKSKIRDFVHQKILFQKKIETVYASEEHLLPTNR